MSRLPITDDAFSNHAPARSVQHSRALALACAGALIALAIGWEWIWAPTGSRTLVVKALPLLLALPGLWRRRLYTYRWVSLAVWLYVTEGLVRATSSAGLVVGLAWTEVLLALGLFIACAWHVRARLRAGLTPRDATPPR